MTGKELFTIAKSTALEFGRDDIGYLAAAVTYYAFFSLFPLMLLGVIGSTLAFQNDADAHNFILKQLGQYIPGMAGFLNDAVTQALQNRNNTGLPALIGVVTLAFSASGAFDALDKSINRAWNSEKMPSIIAAKLTSFAMMGVVGLLMLGSFIVSISLTTVRSVTSNYFGEVPGSQVLWALVNFGASLAVLFLGFLLMYRYVPRCDIGFRDVALGALLAALAWSIAKELFALFLGTTFANFSSVYGPLGTVIALLTWLYVSSVIILTGAEFASETARVRDLRAKLKSQPPTGTTPTNSPWFS